MLFWSITTTEINKAEKKHSKHTHHHNQTRQFVHGAGEIGEGKGFALIDTNVVDDSAFYYVRRIRQSNIGTPV